MNGSRTYHPLGGDASSSVQHPGTLTGCREFPCVVVALLAEATEQLAEAIELAEEAIPYAGKFFDEKWSFSERLAALKVRAHTTRLDEPEPDGSVLSAAMQVRKYWRDWPQQRRDAVRDLPRFLADAIETLAARVDDAVTVLP